MYRNNISGMLSPCDRLMRHESMPCEVNSLPFGKDSSTQLYSYNSDSSSRVPCNPSNESEIFGASLAMVYSPMQKWNAICDEETGLCRGTIFDELNKPFYGPACGRGCENNE